MILSRIMDLVEEKAAKDGISFPSSESVDVVLTVTEKEKEEFLNLSDEDLKNIAYYNLDRNELSIMYSDYENKGVKWGVYFDEDEEITILFDEDGDFMRFEDDEVQEKYIDEVQNWDIGNWEDFDIKGIY